MRYLFLVILALIFSSCNSGGQSASSSNKDTTQSNNFVASASFDTAGTKFDSFKITVYKIAASASEDCTNMKIYYTSTSGVEIDLVNSPEITRTYIPSGDYHCVAVEINNNLKFTPGSGNDFSVGAGNCTIGTESSVGLATSIYPPIIENYDYVTNCSNGSCGLNFNDTGKTVLWFQTKSVAGACSNGNYSPHVNVASVWDNSCGGTKISLIPVSNSGAATLSISFNDISTSINNSSSSTCNLDGLLFNLN